MLHGFDFTSLCDWLRTRCPAQRSTRKEVCGKVQNTFFPRVLTPRGHSIRQYLPSHSPSIVFMSLPLHTGQNVGLDTKINHALEKYSNSDLAVLTFFASIKTIGAYLAKSSLTEFPWNKGNKMNKGNSFYYIENLSDLFIRKITIRLSVNVNKIGQTSNCCLKRKQSSQFFS